MFYKEERVALFIDGANLYAAARALNFDIDFRRFLKEFSGQTRLIRAYYYTAISEDQDYSPMRPLVDWLDYNGFTIVTKPLKEFTDPFGRRKVKGNMDMELAIDMMEMADKLDHIVLVSGDGDFRRLVEAVQRKGVRVTVVSTLKTQPPMVADDLRRQADNFLELSEISQKVGRDRPAGDIMTERDRPDFLRRDRPARSSHVSQPDGMGADEDEEIDLAVGRASD